MLDIIKMVVEMNKNLIPTITSSQAKELHDDKEKWLKYARRITKNKYVKNFLFARDGRKCAWCSNPLWKGHIHHIFYNHQCEFEEVISTETITKAGNVRRKNNVPHCQKCQWARSDLFEKCMPSLVLVHPRCNAEIAKYSGSIDQLEDGK